MFSFPPSSMTETLPPDTVKQADVLSTEKKCEPHTPLADYPEDLRKEILDRLVIDLPDDDDEFQLPLHTWNKNTKT